MSKVFILSDLHLGHHNILKYRSGFSSIEEHDNVLLDNIFTTVGKRDILIMLGDIFFEESYIDRLKSSVRGQISRYILGNHDIAGKVVAEHFNVMGPHKYKGYWLTHIPMHPAELFGKLNIHGHVHTNNIPDKNYFNASVDNISFKPIEFNMIKEIMADPNYDPMRCITEHV
mgnify:CR=1 FL=1